MLIGGIVTLSLGYFFAIIGGITAVATNAAEQASHGASCTKVPGWAFVPLVGAPVVAANYPHYAIIGSGGELHCNDYTGAVTGFIAFDSILQLGGAALIGGGLALNLAKPTSDEAPPPRVMVRPGAVGTPAGFTLVFPWL
jgi:hypothetical protein